MAERLRVLVVEDSPDDAALLERELRRGGYRLALERVETAPEMEAALERQPWDVVLADYALPSFSAPAALAILKRRGLDVPFIIVSGAIGEDTAVAAMRAGAHDYVMKGHLARLVPAIQRELQDAEERRQRHAAESALAREREYTRLLLESANMLIVGLDTEGRITVFNRAAEDLTGYRRAEVQGRNWFELLAPRERYPEAAREFQRLIAHGLPGDHEHTLVTAAGEERIVAWRSVILDDTDRQAEVLAFGIDVTGRRRAEQERMALQHAARRAEKLAALGTLAAGLAHELNNPIGIMSSRIELILADADERALPPGLTDDLRVLHRQAQRVARIASGLLSFARQSSGERMPVDLNHVIEETLLLAARQIQNEGIRLSTRLAPDLPPLIGDASTLQQVLLNLVTNAWDALEDGGELTIETGVLPGPRPVVRVVVADTGRGIEPEVLSRIFDPFFSTKPRGTGLGLAITDGIVREHGGTIDVQSSPGAGTRFILTFPAAIPAAAARDPEDASR